MNNEFYEKLDAMIPNPRCSLEYTRDYELLIATVLSAQCTDARVNIVTKELFSKYDIFSLAREDPKVIARIIYPCGNMNKKSVFIQKIAASLVADYDGKVPNDRAYLENLPGVGHKTANVVLSNLFDVPCFAVDTHVERVSGRLGFAKVDDSVLTIEHKLMRIFPQEKWNRLHHQLVLFGRLICTSRAPKCHECLLRDQCKFYQKNKS